MTKSGRLRPLSTVLFVAACATVVGLCLIPADELPKIGLWDKAEHAMAFGGLAVLGLNAFPRRYGLLAVALLLLGVIIEILQGVMPLGRDPDLRDVVADAVGITAGLIAWVAVTALRRRVSGRWADAA